jgi:hypothetical protein
MEIVTQWFTDAAIIVPLFGLACLLIGIMLGVYLGRGEGSGGGGAREGRNGGRQGRKRSSGKGGEIIEIYIGNLAYEVTEKELNKAFGEFGEVVSTRVIKNRFSGKSKGFGFVELAGRDEANAAIRALNGKDFKGRRIVANEARSRSR